MFLTNKSRLTSSIAFYHPVAIVPCLNSIGVTILVVILIIVLEDKDIGDSDDDGGDDGGSGGDDVDADYDIIDKIHY